MLTPKFADLVRMEDLYAKCKKSSNIYQIEKLNGTLCSLRQIEPDIFPEIYRYVHSYEQELKKLSRDRFYRAKKKKVCIVLSTYIMLALIRNNDLIN